MKPNEFEKQVRDRMAELKIQPSTGNWSEIERRIRKKKSDRRIFWFSLLALCLVVAGSYFWIQQTGQPAPQIATRPAASSPDKADKSATIPQADYPGTHENTPDRAETAIAPAIHSPDVTPKSEEKHAAEQKNHGLVSNYDDKFDDHSQHTKPATIEHPQQENSPGEIIAVNDRMDDVLQKPDTYENETDRNNDFLANHPDSSAKPDDGQSNGDSITARTTEFVQLHQLENENNPATKEQTAVAKGASFVPRNRSWEWSVTVSGGKTAAGEGINFDILELNKSQTEYSYADFGSSYLVSRPATISISKPGSSFGFEAGVRGGTAISRLITLQTGVSYKYYSNTLSAGRHIFYDLTNMFVDNSVNYKNNFHFVEVPLILQFRLNSNKKIPLSANAGISLAHLLTADAVEFKGGYITRTDASLNKTQIGLTAGVSAGFLKRFSAGPFINYNFSQVAGDGIFENKHWNYIGVRIDYLINK